MRTGIKVDKQEVLAVILEDVSGLTHSVDDIKRATDLGKFGSSSQVKGFLTPGSNTTEIIRNLNNTRRRGITVFLSCLTDDLQQRCLTCKCL